MEPELMTHVPEGISVHTTRLPLQKVREEDLIKMATEVKRCAKLLADAEVDVIAYGCTTGSLILNVKERIEKVTSIPVITTAQAVVEALKKEKIKKLAVATPYIKELNEKEKEFLRSWGFEVCKIKGLGLLDNLEIGKQPSEAIYRLGKEVMKSSQADGLFISCTNLRTFEIIKPLSQDIKKPVVTSNQATLWRLLIELGEGAGRWGRQDEMIPNPSRLPDEVSNHRRGLGFPRP
jgi:maleate isomerase